MKNNEASFLFLARLFVYLQEFLKIRCINANKETDIYNFVRLYDVPQGPNLERLSWVSSQPEHNVLSVPTGNPEEESCTWPSAGCVLVLAFYSFS